MANEVLNSLLKDYEKKKLQAEIDCEKRKEQLYKNVPKLSEIEDELNNFAINMTKNILKNGDSSLEKNELEKRITNLKMEKAKILSELHLPSDYLKPHYECKICNDTAYITDSNYKTTLCSCLKQKLFDYAFNKSNMSNLDKENFSTFNANVFSDEVDVAKYKYNISPRRNILNIKDKCLEFVENFDNPNYKNLLFTGNVGLR